jgi:hypothetical protein
VPRKSGRLDGVAGSMVEYVNCNVPTFTFPSTHPYSPSFHPLDKALSSPLASLALDAHDAVVVHSAYVENLNRCSKRVNDQRLNVVATAKIAEPKLLGYEVSVSLTCRL